MKIGKFAQTASMKHTYSRSVGGEDVSCSSSRCSRVTMGMCHANALLRVGYDVLYIRRPASKLRYSTVNRNPKERLWWLCGRLGVPSYSPSEGVCKYPL